MEINKNKKEIYTQWFLKGNKKIEHYVKSVNNTKDGLSIILSCDGKTNYEDECDIELSFGYKCVTYRLTDEAFRLKLYRELKVDPNFDFNWGFYIVKNSNYIFWLNEQSSNLFNDNELIHYSIFDDDFVVDIISKVEPKMKLLK